MTDSTWIKDDWGHTRDWVFVVGLIGSFLLVIASIIALVVGLSRAAGSAGCNTYSRVSGYKTEYVIAHFLDGGSCYVTLPDGKTVPYGQVKFFLNAK